MVVALWLTVVFWDKVTAGEVWGCVVGAAVLVAGLVAGSWVLGKVELMGAVMVDRVLLCPTERSDPSWLLVRFPETLVPFTAVTESTVDPAQSAREESQQ